MKKKGIEEKGGIWSGRDPRPSVGDGDSFSPTNVTIEYKNFQGKIEDF